MILVTDDRYWNTIYQMNKIFQYGYVHANLQDINKYVQKGYRHKMTQKDQSFQKLYLQHVFVRQCREKRDDVVPSALLEYMQTFLPAWKNSPLCDLLLAGDSTDLCRRAALSTVRKMLENLDAQGNLLEITNNNIRWILKGYEHKKEKCQPGSFSRKEFVILFRTAIELYPKKDGLALELEKCLKDCEGRWIQQQIDLTDVETISNTRFN
jgi:hypothetical protein